MTNLLLKGLAWLQSRARLAIEYVLIIAFIALSTYGVTAYVHGKALERQTADLSKRLGAMKGTLDQQVDANEQQDVAINDLKRLREVDSQALNGLHDELDKAGAQGQALREKVRELERTNEKAKALLDTAVPPELGCLLDRAPCAGAGGNNAHGGAGRPPR